MSCDPNKLKELGKTACDALFDLHDYMRKNGDLFWNEVYRMRCDLGSLVGSRQGYAERQLLHGQIEHIDGDPNNNDIANLRIVPAEEGESD